MAGVCLWRPDIATALEFARDKKLPVNLWYANRQRELGPALCAVLNTNSDTTILVTAENIKDILDKVGELHIYFKLDYESALKLSQNEDLVIGNTSNFSRLGFYCRCRIQAIKQNQNVFEITVKTPSRSMLRELRRFERLRVDEDMFEKFRFWFTPTMPIQRGQVQISMGNYSQDMEKRIRLVDISAGGAFVRLTKYDALEGVDIDQNILTLLYLECNGEKKETRFKKFIIGKVVTLNKIKEDNSLNVHLKFSHYLSSTNSSGTLDWQVVEDEGVPDIDAWISEKLGKNQD